MVYIRRVVWYLSITTTSGLKVKKIERNNKTHKDTINHIPSTQQDTEYVESNHKRFLFFVACFFGTSGDGDDQHIKCIEMNEPRMITTVNL